MTVSELFAGNTAYKVSGTGYEPVGEIKAEREPSPTLANNVGARECLLAGMLCNDSALAEKAGRWRCKAIRLKAR